MVQQILVQLGQLQKALAKLESIPHRDDYYRCAVFNIGNTSASSPIVEFSGDVMLVHIPSSTSSECPSKVVPWSSSKGKPLLLFEDVPDNMRGDDARAWCPSSGLLHRCDAATASRVVPMAPSSDRLADLIDELSNTDFGSVRFCRCRGVGKPVGVDPSFHLCTAHRTVFDMNGSHGWRDEVLYLRKRYNLPDTAGSQLL